MGTECPIRELAQTQLLFLLSRSQHKEKLRSIMSLLLIVMLIQVLLSPKMSYLQSLGAFTGKESIFNTLATLTVMETLVRPDFVVISGQGCLMVSRTIQSIPCSHTHSFSAVQATESLYVISGHGHALINLSQLSCCGLSRPHPRNWATGFCTLFDFLDAISRSFEEMGSRLWRPCLL